MSRRETVLLRCQSGVQSHMCYADLKRSGSPGPVVEYFVGHSLFVDRGKDSKNPDFEAVTPRPYPIYNTS